MGATTIEFESGKALKFFSRILKIYLSSEDQAYPP